ncbi:MAG: hypothetical protein ACO1SV_24280 [Fimbriimonas sp.]
MTLRRFAFGLLVSVILAGCGGGGGGTTFPVEETQLNLAAGTGYNGSSSPITGGTAITTTVNGRTVATLTRGSRTLRIELPTLAVAGGQTFAIGGEGGARVILTEVQDRIPVSLTWIGKDGAISIDADTSHSTAEIQLHSATFEGDLTIEGNLADGTFTLEGRVLGTNLTGGGRVGGSGNLGFSSSTNVNASTNALRNGLVVYSHVNGYANLTFVTGFGNDTRVVNVSLLPGVEAGDEFSLTNPLNENGFVTFSAGDGDPAKIWFATGGTLRVTARTATDARVEFSNVTFARPNVGSANTATGTFTLNGVVETN